jgi:hypothetical protein
LSSLAIACVVFAVVFSGALLGLWLGSRLPEHHVNRRTQELVKLGMGTIATLMALVLGLLVANAKSSFDTTANQMKEFSARLLQLDRALERYGPETAETRALLREFLVLKIDQLWPAGRRRGEMRATGATGLLDGAGDRILSMTPNTPVQKALHARALQLVSELGQTRWLVLEQGATPSIPGPFLVVLTLWATILFASFGLFAPRNATVLVVLLVCALSIAAAVLMILELGHPFGGLIRISSAPARATLAQMR